MPLKDTVKTLSSAQKRGPALPAPSWGVWGDYLLELAGC